MCLKAEWHSVKGPGLEAEDPCRIYSFIQNTFMKSYLMPNNINIVVSMTVFPAFMQLSCGEDRQYKHNYEELKKKNNMYCGLMIDKPKQL